MWKKVGNIKGTKGADGLSAYALWLEAGNVGDLDDFLFSIKGEKGDSIKGDDGLSAYEIWLSKGNKGSEEKFLLSLVGKDGKDGKDGLDGQDGLSAYHIWLNQGNEGTEEEFVISLKGKDAQNNWGTWGYTNLKAVYPLILPEPHEQISIDSAGLGVLSVTGTTDRITISGTAQNPTVNISTNYVGQNTITTLGTVTTGAWHGTAVSEVYGGTNQTSYTIGDILYSSATNTLSKLSGNTTTTQKFLSQTGDGVNSAAPVWSDVQDVDVVFTDVTTGNTSAAKHGYAPKLSNSATQFLNGEGNWTTPSGIANAYVAQAFSAVTTVTVTHNFGAYPIVQIIDNTGAVIIPLTTTNISINAFTVTFSTSRTGTVLATVGSPQPAAYTTVTDNYTLLSGDYYVECTASGKTMTLPTAVGRQGQAYSIDNSSSGDINVTTTGGQTIHGNTTVTLPANAVVTVVSNGSNWRIK